MGMRIVCILELEIIQKGFYPLTLKKKNFSVESEIHLNSIF